MKIYESIIVPQGSLKQKEPLEKVSNDIIFQWSFLFDESKHKNIFHWNILEGILCKNYYIFNKKFYVLFTTNSKGVTLKHSFSDQSINTLFVPFGHEVGIKFFLNFEKKKLYSVITSTHSDEAITDSVDITTFLKPKRNLGINLKKSLSKNFVILCQKKI